jgi:hypothetical protein
MLKNPTVITQWDFYCVNVILQAERGAILQIDLHIIV